ncbi:MAG: glycosyltransferase family 4 protein [Coriobacteriia bacterium]|nr:glycosyltransferase family 4 protein [Coriobacteriia bacterium]
MTIGGVISANKVLIFATNDLVTETRARKEAATLAQAGYDVTLAGLGDGILSDAEEFGRVKVRRIARTFATSWRRPVEKLKAVRARAAALGALVDELKPDIVHAVNADGLVAAAPHAKRAHALLVYDAFEIFPEMLKGLGRPFLSWKYWEFAERHAIRQADVALTVSMVRARELHARLGIPFEVVHNVPPLVAPISTGRIRNETGIAADVPIVLYQGVLIAGRGLVRLVQAMADIPDAVLVVQGDGPERAKLEAAAVDAGVAERVVFMGMLPESELHAYACDADIGVVIYEATDLNNQLAAPNKLFAYMMAGLPVAASDLPVLSAIVEDNNIGCTFDTLDTASIAGSLRALLADPLRQNKGARARCLAEECYNWDAESTILLKLYASLVSRR